MTDVQTLSDADLISLYKEVTAPLALPAGEKLPADRPLARWSDDELKAAYEGRDRLTPRERAVDVAASAGIGAVEGGIGVLGMPGDLQSLAAYIARQTGVDPVKMKTILESAPSRFHAPTSGDIKSGIEKFTGEFYEPKTPEGGYARAIAGNWAAAIGPGGAVKNMLKFGAIPGAASEFAGQVLEGQNAEPWGRAGAGMGAGAVVGAIARPRTVASTINRAVRGATEQQMQAAEQLFQDAYAAGQPITRAEALQHVTDGATNMANVQRVVEGQGGLRPFMAQRPAQNEAAIGPVLDSIAPAPTNPSDLGRVVGRAAGEELSDVRQTINAVSQPHYTAAQNTRLTPAEMAQVRALPGYQEARDAVRNEPQLMRYVQGLPEDSVGFLNEVKKQLDRRQQQSIDLANPQKNKQISAGYGQDAASVRNALIRASSDYETALALETFGRENALAPLKSGPIGKLAKTDITTARAVNALFPANPEANAQEITTAVNALAQRSPMAARQLVRAHVERTFSEATQNLLSGANEFGGAKFAAVIRGNPQQAANLEAAVRALPNGDQIYTGFDRFLQFVEAQGQRQRIGSNTAFNTEMLRDMSRGTPTQEATTAVLGAGMQIPARVRDGMERWRLGAGVAEIADLLTNPRAGDLFRVMAHTPTGSREAAVLASKLTFLGLRGIQSSDQIRK